MQICGRCSKDITVSSRRSMHPSLRYAVHRCSIVGRIKPESSDMWSILRWTSSLEARLHPHASLRPQHRRLRQWWCLLMLAVRGQLCVPNLTRLLQRRPRAHHTMLRRTLNHHLDQCPHAAARPEAEGYSDWHDDTMRL